MSYNGPPNRSPFQQNSRSVPSNNSQRSPQIRKFNSCPAWGSGAIHHKNNGPSSGQFSSPASYNITSPPSFNNGNNSGHNFTSPPQQPQFYPARNQMRSPRHHPPYMHNRNQGYPMFRTPQPMNRFPRSPQKSLSCDRNFRPTSKRLDMKSPRRNPNSNPGGSNDIEQYYHPSMLADPWQKLTPVPVTHAPAITT